MRWHVTHAIGERTMTLFEAFELTPEERTRLVGAPFAPGEGAWLTFATMVHEQVLAAYAAGEIDFRQMLVAVRSCSLGCTPQERIGVVALTVERGLRLNPRTLNRKRPPNPKWVRYSAATLVQMLREAHPKEAVAPNEVNGWTTPILEAAISWLTALGLCRSGTEARTVYNWYLEGKKNGALSDTPPFSTYTA